MIGFATWDGPYSISGHPLQADRIVQVIYLDEAGISRKDEEPYLVVAGPIINPDRRWKEIARHLHEITVDLFPDEDEPIVFQAKHIWHGGGRFDRQKWSRDDRLAILLRLAKIPALFGLPIVAGYLKRADAEAMIRSEQPNISDKHVRVRSHAEAFIRAIRRAQEWMSSNASDELAMVIAEDTHEVREALNFVHKCYTRDAASKVEEAFHASHIVDAINYAQKDTSLLLQVADHCAFILKRKLMKCPLIEPMFKALEPQLAMKLLMKVPIAHIRAVDPVP